MKNACSLLVFLCSVSYVKGQDLSHLVWKKNVARDIDTRDKHTGKLPKSGANDSTLVEKIVYGIKTGIVTAYNSREHEPVKMTIESAMVPFFGIFDSFPCIHSVNYIPSDPIEHEKPFPDSFYQYRMYEEWNFYPSEGKTHVQIKYIAPIQRLYHEDGTFRGSSAVCKLKYNDVISLTHRFDDSTIRLSFFGGLWESYFDIDSGGVIARTTEPSGLWHTTATRIIDIGDQDDTSKHFIENSNDDTLLSELIVVGITKNELQAWSAEDKPFDKRLSKEQLTELVAGRYDTIAADDPITEMETEIISFTEFNYADIHKYKILEDWTFDPITGKTTIAIKGIAPIKDINNDRDITIGTKTMFWIKFADMRKILDRIEQYYPENTFAMHIWDSYFISGVKPTYENR